jgi:replicative DNA helicase
MTNQARAWIPRIVTNEQILRIELGAQYERTLACRLCEAPKLWATIGVHLKPEWFKDKPSQTILRACAQVAKGTGHGPSSVQTVSAVLKQVNSQGKLSDSEFKAAMNALIEYEGAPADHDIINHVAPLIRDTLRGAIIDGILAARSKNPDADLGQYGMALQAVEQVGRDQRVIETTNGYDDSVFDKIDSLNRQSRLALGIPELDYALEGGVFRQTLICFGADSNVGKSHLLLHAGLNASAQGMRVIYVTTFSPLGRRPSRGRTVLLSLLSCRVGPLQPSFGRLSITSLTPHQHSVVGLMF